MGTRGRRLSSISLTGPVVEKAPGEQVGLALGGNRFPDQTGAHRGASQRHEKMFQNLSLQTAKESDSVTVRRVDGGEGAWPRADPG